VKHSGTVIKIQNDIGLLKIRRRVLSFNLGDVICYNLTVGEKVEFMLSENNPLNIKRPNTTEKEIWEIRSRR